MEYKQINRNILTTSAYWLVNKAFAKYTNNDTAILLSDLIAKEEYFENMGMLTSCGFFFNTAKNIEEDTAIKRDKQKEYINNLEKLGILETKLIGLPRRKHFKINHKGLLQVFSEIKNPEQEMPVPPAYDMGVSRLTPETETSTPPHLKLNSNIDISNKDKDSIKVSTPLCDFPASAGKSSSQPHKKPPDITLSLPDEEILSQSQNRIKELQKEEKELWKDKGHTLEYSSAFVVPKNSNTKTFYTFKKYLKQLQEGNFLLENPCSADYEKMYGDKVYRYKGSPLPALLDAVFEMMAKYMRYRINTPSEIRKTSRLSPAQFLYNDNSSHPSTTPSYFRCMHVTEVGQKVDTPSQIKAVKKQISAFNDIEITGDTCIRAMFPNLNIKKWPDDDILKLLQSIYRYFKYIDYNKETFNPRKRDGLLYRAARRWRTECAFYDIEKCRVLPQNQSDFMKKFFTQYIKDVKKG